MLLKTTLITWFCGGVFTSLLFGTSAPQKSQALLDKGKALFSTSCASCHGEKGDGNSPIASALNPKPRNFLVDKLKNGDSVQNIFDSISKGIPGGSMVAFASIPENDRWGLAYYVKSLIPEKKTKAKESKKNQK